MLEVQVPVVPDELVVDVWRRTGLKKEEIFDELPVLAFLDLALVLNFGCFCASFLFPVAAPKTSGT